MNAAPLTMPPYLLQLRERAAHVSARAITLLQVVQGHQLAGRFEQWFTETCTGLAGLHERLDRILGQAELPRPSDAERELIKATFRLLQHEVISLSKDFSACVAEFRQAGRKGLPDPKDEDLILAISDQILDLLRPPVSGQIALDAPTAQSPDNIIPFGMDHDDWRDEDDQPESDPNLLEFHVEDRVAMDMITQVVREHSRLMRHQADARERLRVLLFALDRLPLATPGVKMEVACRERRGDCATWVGFRIWDDELTFEQGSWEDGEADSEIMVEIGPGYREGDVLLLHHFAEEFVGRVRDGRHQLVIDDQAETPFDSWHLEVDPNRWDDVPFGFC